MRTRWPEYVGWWLVGAGAAAILSGLALIAIRYALHPQQFRDVHYEITRTVYVIAQKRKGG